MSLLRKYWFRFDNFDRPTALNLGCGVTAYGYDDAIYILNENIFSGRLPNILSFVEDINIQDLDKGHIIPNMGNFLTRGVWFPLGYSENPDFVRSE